MARLKRPVYLVPHDGFSIPGTCPDCGQDHALRLWWPLGRPLSQQTLVCADCYQRRVERLERRATVRWTS